MPAREREISRKPVVVVGGGPVGMVAAASLARLDVPVVLVEAEDVPKTDWRASTFHAATLELLEELGVAEQMHAEGLRVPVYQFRDRREGLVAEFDFSLLADETDYPYRLQLNQQHLVRMLHERLSRTAGVELLFGTRVEQVEQTADGEVSVVARDAKGTRTLRASYVIGADGAGSTVRQSLGIDFVGYTYPERFLIASTEVDLSGELPGIADVNYVADPLEWLFLLRTPESWRVVWPVPAGQTEEEATEEATLQRQFQRVAPRPSGYPIVDYQLYRVHQRVAETFRVGNTVLVGDAAHINSPMGGVGLNSGIHDAVDIARRAARIRSGEGDPELELSAFADIRHKVAVEYVQADTQRNTDRLKETDEALRRATHEEMRAIAADPVRARAYMRRVSLLESVRRFGIGVPPGHGAQAGYRPPEVRDGTEPRAAAGDTDTADTDRAIPTRRTDMPAADLSTPDDPELRSLYEDLAAADLRPLWTITEQLLTPTPRPRAVPWLWRSSVMRPLAERAIRLVPVERGGERRVLSLVNPGLGGRPYAAGTLWGALQCLGPGETAPAHRHTPGAIRFVLDGHGVWTTVNGDSCDMRPGDLVLTPGGVWHDHANGGDGKMFWFDGLDLPMIEALDAVFFEPHPEFRQPEGHPHNRSEADYPAAGGTPENTLATGAVRTALDPSPSPLLVYRWAATDERLTQLAADGGPLVSVEFTNPRSGASVLPTLACAAHRIVAGGSSAPLRRSGNTVYVVFRGEGTTVIGGQRFDWSAGDMFVVPSWAPAEHASTGGADLFSISDTPVLRALGIYREETLPAPQEVTSVFD